MTNSRQSRSHKSHRINSLWSSRTRRRRRVPAQRTWCAAQFESLESRLLLATASVGALKDNTLYEQGQGDISNGRGNHIFAGKTNTDGLIRRAVIAFDIQSAGIPAGSSITDVTLNLAVSKSRATSPDPVIAVHRLTKDWGEGRSDAENEEGMGIAAERLDATWIHPFFDSTMWDTPGGDFEPAPSATALVGGVGTTAVWTSPELAADVQTWVDNPTPNFGWILVGDEASNGTARRFWSKDSLSGLNPRLDITFELESLSLSLQDSSISENGGSTMATVTRTKDAGDLDVTLFSDDASEATVMSSVVIPDGQRTSVPFAISAVDDLILDGPQVVQIIATAPGHVSGSEPLVVTDFEPLEVSINDASIVENGGATTGVVTRTDSSFPLTVDLVSDDASEATVVATVQLAAGEAVSPPFAISAVDDAILDGTQTVAVTASAAGFEPGSGTFEVSDFEELSLSIDAESIQEMGGTSTATVTRTDPSGTLTVNLESRDATEATVVPSVVIADGQTTSPAFTISAVEDGELDGTQAVTITATAPGYEPASDSLEVTDFGPLLVIIEADSLSELGGTTMARVIRSDSGGNLTVDLFSGDTSEVTVVPSVVIRSGQTESAPFEITAVDDSILDGTQLVTITARAIGYGPGTDSLDVTDFEELAVAINADSISENGSSTTGTVSRTDSAGDLTVELLGDDPTGATVTASVTIADGQLISPPFTISAVDDAVVDGTQTVTVTAQAPGYQPATDSIDITDFEELTVSIDAETISENGGSTTAIVTRTDPSGELVVSLASDDTTEASVTGTVTIADGETSSAPFTIDAVDDQLLDGTQTVSISASAEGYQSAVGVLGVTDFEMLGVSLAASSISESGGMTTGTVTRPDPSGELTVNLSSDSTDEATVPSFIVIPDGALTADFDITSVDDTLLDGVATVGITVSANGFAPSSAVLEVTDFEPLIVTVGTPQINEAGGFSTASVRRPGTLGDLVVNLVSSDPDEATVLTTVTIPNGLRDRSFLIRAVNDNALDGNQEVTVTASAVGHIDGSVTATIVDDDTVTITVDASADNTLYEDPAGAKSNGAGSYLFAGRTAQPSNSVRRALVEFDLASEGIPEGSTVLSANLELFVSMSTSTDSQPISLHRILADWGEGASDAPGEEGAGTDPAVSDATWLHTFYDTQLWSTAGGDFDAAASASTDVGGTGSTATWSSSDLMSDVQNWLDQPEQNNGWALIGNEDVERTNKRFDSRNRVGGTPPQLSVTYAPPTEQLTLSVSDASISENGGETDVIVVRSGDLSTALNVTLSSDDVSEAVVPATITIAQNASSATFVVTAVDDDILDGTVSAQIRASAIGFVPASSVVEVTDFEGLSLTIVEDFISEAGGTATATVTRVGTAGDLTINVTSGDLSEIAVGGPIIIRDGQTTSDPFTISAVNDTVLDGSQTVSVIVSATGYESGSDSLVVQDDDTTAVEIESGVLTITGSDSRSENLTFRLVGNNLVISDPFNAFATAGSNSSVAQEIFLPLADFPNGVRVAVEGISDSLILNETIDNPTGNLLSYDGGSGTDRLVVQGNGLMLNLSQFTNVELIDLRGNGDNQISLDLDAVLQTAGPIRIQSDLGDTVSFDNGWTLNNTVVSDGVFYRVMVRDSGQFLLGGPADWQNPINPLDLNNDGLITATGDVLPGINELNAPRFIDNQGTLPVQPTTAMVSANGPFYDWDGNGVLSPADILARINFIHEQFFGAGGEGEGGMTSAGGLDDGVEQVSVSPFNLASGFLGPTAASAPESAPVEIALVVGQEPTDDRFHQPPAGQVAGSGYRSAVDELISEFDSDDLLDEVADLLG